jgi:hypothetical protein
MWKYLSELIIGIVGKAIYKVTNNFSLKKSGTALRKTQHYTKNFFSIWTRGHVVIINLINTIMFAGEAVSCFKCIVF